MKKHLLQSLVGLAALLSAVAPGYGQGKINLDNYDSTLNPLITYGSDFDPSLSGTGLQNNVPGGITWTVGFYYALGDVTGSVAADPTTVEDPGTLGGGLTLASGALGDTTTIGGIAGPGYFTTTSDAVINGYSSGLVTLEVIVYDGSSYFSSTFRSHSSAFTMTPATANTSAPLVGEFMPAFAVNIIPEPATFALAGSAAALLIAFRGKRKA